MRLPWAWLQQLGSDATMWYVRLMTQEHYIEPHGPTDLLCPHFGECGGCASQDVTYDEQVRRKGAALEELFAPYWHGPVPVQPSPEIWHYRNKVDPSFGAKFYPELPPPGFERETVLGFKRKGRWFHPLEILECRIGPRGLDALLGAVRAWAHTQKLPPYSTRSHKGFLRGLLVREGKRTGERMVVLVTTDGDFDKGSFVDAVQAAWPAHSVCRAIFRGKADVTWGEEIEVLAGSASIEEQMRVPDPASPRELRFRLSPFSFFQTNTLAAEQLYGAVRAWVRSTAPVTLYDLYGGMGSIAFACSDLVENVTSVENVEEASKDGLFNAAVNKIDNVTFFAEKVEDYLRTLLEADGLAPGSAVIVDPPRAGLHPKALRRLMELRPRHLLYISCKPTVLAQEMAQFVEHYRLDDLRAVDMFPHTPHAEVVAALALRD